MIEIIITVVVVLSILTLVMFLLLKKIVDEINTKSKEYFTLKLQDYDELIDERAKKLSNIKVNLENDDKELEKIKDDVVSDGTVEFFDKVVEYQQENILQKVKYIDSRFQIDNEKVILNFLKTKQDLKKSKLYHELISLKNDIMDYGIYNILINKENVVLNILKTKSLDCQSVMNYYLELKKDINVNDFLEFLDIEIGKHDPTIYIEVGDKNLNYNYISNNIKTIYNEKIYKGIKIYYRNYLYDYSLE